MAKKPYRNWTKPRQSPGFSCWILSRPKLDDLSLFSLHSSEIPRNLNRLPFPESLHSNHFTLLVKGSSSFPCFSLAVFFLRPISLTIPFYLSRGRFRADLLGFSSPRTCNLTTVPSLSRSGFSWVSCCGRKGVLH